MPKPLKSLLIVFSIFVFAGILALVWNQWPWPTDGKVADSASPGSGQVSQPADAGSGQTAAVDTGTAKPADGQPAQSATTGQAPAAGENAAATVAADQPAAAATDTGAAADAAAEGEQVAAVTPQTGTGTAQSPAPQGEVGVAPDTPAAPGAAEDAGAAAADKAGAAVPPSFDIVRVEPSGDTVIAGRGAPDAKVELLSNGSVIAKTKADKSGEFVFVLENPLAAGGHDLALRTSGGEGVSIYSTNNVAVAVPEEPSGEVLVVMNEPGAASKILAKPDEPAGAGGETVVATAPSAETLSSETQIAAAPAPQASAVTEPAEQIAPQATVEAEPTQQMAAADPAAPAVDEPAEQMATTDPAAPAAAEPTEQMAAADPVAPIVAGPAEQVAEATPAEPEQQPQPAEIAPAVPETQPQPQVAETATVEKPAGDAAGQVADAGQPALEAAPEPSVPLSVEAVEVEGETLYAAGKAKGGTMVRVYVDNKLIGETTTFENNRWLVESLAKVPAGTVIVRADQLAPERASVVARAEVPFTRQIDAAVLVPTAAGGSPTGATAQAELPRPNAVIIRRGDNLWTISRRTYGRGIRYTTIYTANKDQIRNPHMIFPGQVFMLPVGEKSWTQ